MRRKITLTDLINLGCLAILVYIYFPTQIERIASWARDEIYGIAERYGLTAESKHVKLDMQSELYHILSVLGSDDLAKKLGI